MLSVLAYWRLVGSAPFVLNNKFCVTVLVGSFAMRRLSEVKTAEGARPSAGGRLRLCLRPARIADQIAVGAEMVRKGVSPF
jgi:hypothetical protein